MSFLTERNTFRLLLGVFVLGTVYRLYPVFAGQPALAQFFITEDGYLMLTIARNMAIGLGMSVSDGTIASNGVQPLATFLFAIPYWLTGGDKVTSLAGVQLIATAISVAGIFSVRALARMALKPFDDNPIWPWMVAALWFVSPLLLFHTMNGLETGLYTLALTTTLVLFGRLLEKGDEAGWGDRLILGAACGVTFLARNDAVFLITAIFAVWFAHELFTRRTGLARAVANLVPPGVVSLIIAAPWLINNYVNFGSIVPVSGTAQALSGGLAKNADLVPAKLFEYAFPMLPVPAALETQPWFQWAASLIVLVIILSFVVMAWRRGGALRRVVLAYAAFALVMVAYYGFYFGAGWFLSRYLSPLAPLLLLATGSALLVLLARLTPARALQAGMVLGVAGLVLSLTLLGLQARPGARDQGHFQVVNWIGEHVEEDIWVGAVQTGTVGYWHDRTINLDGKVNPAALDRILNEGHVLNYVLESEIEILADWAGIATWTTTGNKGNEAFSAAFELVSQNEDLNLGVLRRR